MSDGRAAMHDTTFTTGLLPSGLILPGISLFVGTAAIIADAWAFGLAFLGIAALLAGLFGDSVLRIEEGVLGVRMFALRERSVKLVDVTSVFCEPAAASFGRVPVIRFVDRTGHRVSVSLGWWRREAEFLAHLEGALHATDARVDAQTRQLLRRKPPGAFWDLKRRGQPHPRRGRASLPKPLDRPVYRIGIASMLLGLALVAVTIQTRPGVGSFGLVPEAMAGFQAIGLGWVAVLLARPPSGIGRAGRGSWLLLGASVLSTGAVLILTLDDIGAPIELEPRLARLIVVVGRAVIVGGIVWLIVVLVFKGFGFVWRSFLDAGADRWMR